MKKLLKILGGLLALVIVAAAAGYFWAGSKAKSLMSRTMSAHTVDFPIPFPLDDSVVKRLKLTPDSAAKLALSHAAERGKHLVESRYACIECHGANFGGGTMIDAAIIGRFLGPNITLGAGSRTTNYKAVDWDHIVRHGIKAGGNPGSMPSQDFVEMSDQELSDIVAYIRTQPNVDSTVPPVTLGPLGKFLVATGKMQLAADVITDHNVTHTTLPPAAVASVEFGKHVAMVCSGCHQASFAGGPIVGADPSWPPAKNLTSHPDALGKWTLEQFKATLRTAKRPDGTDLKPPMSGLAPYANKMKDVEIEALWMYLQSLPQVAPVGT
ncbi:MAG TPA: cytochrome c [Gemmatimonadaceae bacterium]|nr:cytochrome c [Gemmatimonadaceae bacterium]